ncbi:FMN-dependent NADH-azoreductase [Kordiimonas marina]|uniref:FMN-dependent NADH-azoreductase n=1 Tax=Kordiimonas marina TaxID=2872312 RepID=UPI001FF6ADE4|nr:NAD(P)H-dependent oxidoreductase [Kordiimonas marina]MCJ9427564.1 NAD(P)H-dependent oxidoreductase [Kordiimonas marina]
MATQAKTLLRLDASVRTDGSVTRGLTEKFVHDLTSKGDSLNVTTRDLANGLPLIDEAWTAANFTAPEDRTDDQKEALALSDSLIEELKAADILVIGLPVYNFGVPAALKAWVDLISRARVTFRYTEDGPEGLLKGKKAYVLTASGGTPVGSGYDFATTYLRHILGFVGIDDVTIIAADQMAMNADAALEAAHNRIEDEVAALQGLRTAA